MASNKTVKTLSVKFEGDTKKLKQAINEATAGFNDIGKAAKTLDAQFEKFGTGASFEKQTEALRIFEEQVKSGEKALSKLIDYRNQLLDENPDNAVSSEFQRLNKIIAETTDTIAKAKTRIDEAKASLSGLVKDGANIEKIASTFEKIREKSEETNRKFQNTQNYIEAINKALEYSPNNVELLNLQTQKYEEQLKTCRSETQSLAANLRTLKDNGVNELSQQYIELTNRLNESKAKYQELKLETASYHKALNEASKLANDIATRGNALKQALEIDPSNTELLAQYQKVLAEEIEKSEASANAFRKAINEINPNGVVNVKEQYIELTTGLTKAQAQTKALKEEQAKYSDEVVEYNKHLKEMKSKLSETSSTANVLKKALELDPTNTKKQQQYTEYLQKAIEKCKDEQIYFNNKLKEMDTKNVPENSKAYVEVLNNLNQVVEKEQQYNNELVNLGKVTDNTKKYANELKKALQLDPSNTQKQKQYTDFLAVAIEKCKSEQIKLNNELEEMNSKGVEKTSDEYVELLKNINDVVEEQKEYETQLNATNNALSETASAEKEAVVQTADFNTSLMAVHQILQKVASELNKFTGTLFDNAMSYESSVASIKKVVTDLTDDTVDSLKEIAIQSGNTFDSIAEYATLGATLGITQDALDDFTNAMVKLETASDGSISGEDGAKAVARLLNQFNIGAEYAENFGSAVTYVGDQFAATANEILETASYMGGLSAINNVTINDLVGLASEMKNLGIETASGASAVSKVFLTIDTQVATSGKKLKTFASTAGMTAEEFAKVWETAPTDAFLSFVNGLSTKVFDEINESVSSGTGNLEEYASALNTTTDSFRTMWNQDPTGTFEKYKDALGDLEEGTESASSTLTDLSLSGVRVAQTLLKLAGNGNVVRKAIKDSSKAWEENTNLTKKANTVYETTEKKLESAKEALRQAAASLGDTFLPLVKKAADIVTSLTKTFNALPKSAKVAVAGTTLLATGVANIGAAGIDALIKLRQLSVGSDALALKCQSLLSTISSPVGLVSALGTALPIALGLAGTAAVAYAMYSTYANNETRKFNQEVETLTEQANTNYIQGMQSMSDELIEVKEAFENAGVACDNLEFNRNGRVDTSKESYTNLKEAISRLNGILGESKYHLDEETGAIEDQEGKVVNLKDAWKEYFAEKQRATWLDANEEKYNSMLSERDEALGKLKSKYTEIKEAKDQIANDSDLFGAFTEEDWSNFESVKLGYKDIDDFSGSAKSNIEQMQSLVGSTFLEGLYQDAEEFASIATSSQQFVDAYNSVDNAAWDEVGDSIERVNELVSSEVEFHWDSNNIDSMHQALDQVNDDLESLQQIQSLGASYDTTSAQQSLEDEKLKILEAISEYYNKDKALSDSTSNTSKELDASKKLWSDYETAMTTAWDNTVKGIDTSLNGEEGLFAETGQASQELSDIISKALIDEQTGAFPKLKETAEEKLNSMMVIYGEDKTEFEKGATSIWTTIHKDVYETSSQSSSSRTTNGKGSTSGGFNTGFTSLVPDLTIPKLSSGGHGTMTLKASFTINNNGDNITQSMSQKIGKQIVNYINEELGKGI